MKPNVHIRLLLLFVLLIAATAISAQPGFQVDIKKEKPFEERKLKAEKTGEGPIKAHKRIWNNVTTRFNYHFNANNKLAEIVERAKQQHRDDYSQLLPFYNYSLATLAADSAQLDSVIYKCRTALVNHDLRSEWTDEMYLLWARSWHYQQKLDSASMMLQFINYAYAPQEEYGYYSYIGSRKDGAQELTIATPEKKKLLHANNFSRNEAFLWQVRTLTELENYTRAGSLITTLKRDPVFPERLEEALHEAEAYWWYKQGRWDSAATYLIAAIDGADGKREKARWWYLIAQLMERSGKSAVASEYYAKAIASTPDPVLEVYGRLNLVRINKEGGEGAIDKNVAELLKMAKRDKYEEYRDVIYFMAAQMEMERGNIAAAQALLMQGAKYNNGNLASRNRAFLQIADLSFDQKKYVQASAFYDSVQVNDLNELESSRIFTRKPPLQIISAGSGTIQRQDSLQRIAAMPPEEREDYINKLVKRLRREQGLKDDGPVTSGANPLTSAGQAGNDIFTSGTKGVWDNPSARTQGANEFKRIWGTRPNVDNWRRFAVVSQTLIARDPMNTRPGTDVASPLDAVSGTGEINAENLIARLPATPEALKASNDSIRGALMAMGAAFINQLEDFASAIETYNELRRRFPDAQGMDEVLFNLHFANQKANNMQAAAEAKRELLTKFPKSRYAAILATGKDPMAASDKSPEATKAYENVYNLFIEGNFNEAVTAKRLADSTYKTTFWQPQLLYIEAVYNIKQRDDSTAIKGLQTIIRQNSNPALTTKAENLVNVLSRRRQIEDELNAYQMSTGADTASSKPTPSQVVVQKPPVKSDTASASPKVDPAVAAALEKRRKDSLETVLKNNLAQSKKDSAAFAAMQVQARRDSLALAKQQTITARRDSLAKASAEAQRRKEALAEADKARRDSLATVKAALDQARKDSLALAQALRRQATDSAALSRYLVQRAKDSTARVNRELAAAAKKRADEARKDSLARLALQAQARRDSIALAKSLRDAARRDSIQQRQAYLQQQRDSTEAARRNAKPPVPQGPKSIFSHTPDAPHLALVILDKVDPVFVNEARNAFFRYSRERYYGQPIDVQIFSLTADIKLLLVSGLVNEQAAVEYAQRSKGLAPTEIVPWLTGNKYTFSVISAANMEVLKANPDLNVYKKFLEQYLPVKF